MRTTLLSLLFALLFFGCSDAPEEQPKPEDGSPSSEAGLSKGSALVLTLAGKVTVISPSDAKENAAYVNQFLSPGDSLSTDPDSEALLLLTNGTTLSVGANTTFELKAFYQADFKGGDAKVGSLEEEASDSTILLDLKVGDLVVDVRKLKKKSNFEITTPLGVAGIRGTSFRLSASADSTKLSVLTGLVGFVSNDKKENQVGAEKVLVSSREKEPVINDLTDAQKQSIAQTVARAKKEADEISLSTLRDKLGKSFKTHLIPSAGNLEMIWVEPGKFTMGSPTNETGRETNEAELNVTLTKGFYLGKYEVTQAQWNAVKNTAPSHFSGNVRPVEQVSWTDATAFCATLTQLEQNAGRLPSGWAYVLPTEAQWEYACRAGTTTAYSWGNSIANSNANYNSNIGQTRDVGQYAANPWGFFDMHGNVWEWVNDRYQNAYPGETVTDPTGFASGPTRILRGGDWGNAGTTLRSARRTYLSPPSHRRSTLGFRLSLRPVSK